MKISAIHQRFDHLNGKGMEMTQEHWPKILTIDNYYEYRKHVGLRDAISTINLLSSLKLKVHPFKRKTNERHTITGRRSIVKDQVSDLK